MQKKPNLLRLLLSTVVNLPPEEPEGPPAPLDPDALAELDGSMIIGRRREEMPKPVSPPPPQLPIDADGHVNFGTLYTQAHVPTAKFTAEQAIEAVRNVEKTIPANIPETSRPPMVKAMLAAFSKSTNGATPEAIALDAANKIDALKSFIRERSNDLVDLTQAADDAIKALEDQIEAKKKLKEAASGQFENMARECADEQSKLNALIDLLSAPDASSA